MFQEKNVVVTGAGKGVGRALALGFAREGATVLVHYGHNEAGARSAVKEILQAGGKAFAVKADFQHVEELEYLVQQASERLGSIDVWINNAGASANSSERLGHSPLDIFQDLINVDVRGTWWCSRQIHPLMRENSSIITLGWDGALAGGKGLQSELYALSKGAVMSLTRCLAQEYAPRVRVNCIVPGFIENDWSSSLNESTLARFSSQIPLQRWGNPSDIVNLALFLSSPLSSYITGQLFLINGGHIMH